MLKVCNLYCGIGGNRKLWENVDVTAIENNKAIADIYHDFFPLDKVIVTDAHEYLLKHFEEFDFIWSSPPCPSHSRVRKLCAWKTNPDGTKRLQNKPIYPDMKLYEEILLLDGYFKGKWCVENVISFYEPLIKPYELGRHYFWTNFHIANIQIKGGEHFSDIEKISKRKGYNLSAYSGVDRKLLLRNCVEEHLGLHILNESKRDIQPELFK